jgi:hypothetical protein
MRTHAIDALDADTRRVIYLTGREILGKLNPPRTPLEAFEEFNESDYVWLVGRIRSRILTNPCHATRQAVAALCDDEVVTVVFEEHQVGDGGGEEGGAAHA